MPDDEPEDTTDAPGRIDTTPLSLRGADAPERAADLLHAYADLMDALHGDDVAAVTLDVHTEAGRHLSTADDDMAEVMDALATLNQALGDAIAVDGTQWATGPPATTTATADAADTAAPPVTEADTDADTEADRTGTGTGTGTGTDKGTHDSPPTRPYAGPTECGEVSPRTFRFMILETLAGQDPLTNAEIEQRITRLFPDREHPAKASATTVTHFDQGLVTRADVDETIDRSGRYEYELTEAGRAVVRAGLQTRAEHHGHDPEPLADVSMAAVAGTAEYYSPAHSRGGRDPLPPASKLRTLYENREWGPGTHRSPPTNTDSVNTRTEEEDNPAEAASDGDPRNATLTETTTET
jgi:DNA-binding PadR family transcriptional regulator